MRTRIRSQKRIRRRQRCLTVTARERNCSGIPRRHVPVRVVRRHRDRIRRTRRVANRETRGCQGLRSRCLNNDPRLRSNQTRRVCVGHRNRLCTRGLERGCEGVLTVIGRCKRVVSRQNGLWVRARELDRAQISDDHVPIRVDGTNGEGLGCAGRVHRRKARNRERIEGGGNNRDARLRARDPRDRISHGDRLRTSRLERHRERVLTVIGSGECVAGRQYSLGIGAR